MVVQLGVSTEMINCFHACAAKDDYRQLLEDYSQFFGSLTEHLLEVDFVDTSLSTICKKAKFIFSFFSTWIPNRSVSQWGEETMKTMKPDLDTLGFFPRLVLAMRTKNWDGFYEHFLPFFDIVIETARRQEIFDLKIEFLYELYDTFEMRDEARQAFYHQNFPNDSSEPKSETFQVNQQEETSQLESRTRVHESSIKPLEDQMKLSEEQCKGKMEKMSLVDKKINEQESKMNEKIEQKLNELVAKFEKNAQNREEQLKLKEETLDRKIEGIKGREESLELKLGAVMKRNVQEEFKISEEMLDRKIEESLTVKLEAMIKRSVQKQQEQLKLKEDLLNKRFEKMETLVEPLNEKLESAIEKSVQEQLKLREDSLNTIMEDTKIREDLLDKKMEEMIKRNAHEHREQLKLKEELLDGKFGELIQRSAQENEEKLKLKEDSLNKNLQEMKTLEESLNEKMEAVTERSIQELEEKLKLKEEAFDNKIEEVKSKEDILDKKINAMLRLMDLLEQQNQPKVAESLKTEATGPDPRNCPTTSDPTSPRSLPVEDLLDEDEEIRQIQEKFKREEAEQITKHAAEMEAVKERGRQKNEKAQGEIRELERSLSRVRERASFRL